MKEKITIKNISSSIQNVKIEDGEIDPILTSLNNAQRELDEALFALNNITVKGKDSMDVVLGCIMAIELIIGIEGE